VRRALRGPCSDWQYEVEDGKRYHEIWDAVSNLVDNPYELEDE
jgi:hypothetical protein